MFYLKNFKNFEFAEIDDLRPVTLLVGPNGSGKSNLIEGIELLCFLATGHPLHEVTDLGREGGLEIRGGLDACASYGQDKFTLGYRSEGVDYQISVRVGKEPRIISEELKIDARGIPVFETLPGSEETASADNHVRYDNNARGVNKPVVSVAADRSALSQYVRFASGNQKLPQTLEWVDAVLNALAPPAVFDPIPKLMRNYERATETRLARNGFNISPILYGLSRSYYVSRMEPKSQKVRIVRLDNSEISARILKRIAQLPDEPFESFDFVSTKAGDVMFGFKIPHGEKSVTARVLSDGTLRALGILTALETSTKGTHLVLEELDNGVHPSRVHLLSEALFECADRNELHVLATTQNPATLNSLTVDQLKSVLLVVPDAGKKFARLLPINELPGYIEFVEQGRLGDLITRRVYERHLRADYETERKRDIEKWMGALP